MRRFHIFILGILTEGSDSRWHGQLSQPNSQEIWRAFFQNTNELLTMPGELA